MIPIAYILWFVTFYVKPSNFWIDISISSLILFSIAIKFSKPFPMARIPKLRNIVVGISSAAFLYLVFLAGGSAISFLHLGTAYVGSIYSLASNTNPFLLTILLAFPIASGEESFWRGYIQEKFSRRFGPVTGIIVSILGDTTVHISSLNPVLVGAAFVTSICWALIFRYTHDLSASLTSHIIWDILVFVILPVST